MKLKFKDFFSFLKQNKTRQFNFFLSLFIFCLLPVQNYYTDLNISPGQPIVRPLDFDLAKTSLYPVNITDQQCNKCEKNLLEPFEDTSS